MNRGNGLVLSREVGEVVEIGPDITVCVADVRGDKVRLAIKAPPSVAITRPEQSADVREGIRRRGQEHAA